MPVGGGTLVCEPLEAVLQALLYSLRRERKTIVYPRVSYFSVSPPLPHALAGSQPSWGAHETFNNNGSQPLLCLSWQARGKRRLHARVFRAHVTRLDAPPEPPPLRPPLLPVRAYSGR